MDNFIEDLIATCGINCHLCVSYQFRKNNLNKQGFNRSYCPGCIPRGENCTHIGGKCEITKNGKARFCFECNSYPCKILKALDKRYRTKYRMSMIENLDFIRKNCLNDFLKKEEKKWKCPECGGVICCHNGLCLECRIDVLKSNKKYRWNE